MALRFSANVAFSGIMMPAATVCGPAVGVWIGSQDFTFGVFGPSFSDCSYLYWAV